MAEISVSFDSLAARAFKDALGQLSKSLGKAAAQAPRRAAIMICKSFRAGTVNAKKNRGMSVRKGKTEPHIITYKNGIKLPKPLRRYTVTLKDRGRTFDRFVYDEEDARQQLRKLVGTNYYPRGDKSYPQRANGTRGLAKRSWGWCMHNIFKGAAPDTPWARRKNDRRNPKDATKDSTSSTSGGTYLSGGYARICNRLSYIADQKVLKVSPDDAMAKASARIVGTLANRRLKSTGMSSEEIRAEASRITRDFKREFGL